MRRMASEWKLPRRRCPHGWIVLDCSEDDCPTRTRYLAHHFQQLCVYEALGTIEVGSQLTPAR